MEWKNNFIKTWICLISKKSLTGPQEDLKIKNHLKQNQENNNMDLRLSTTHVGSHRLRPLEDRVGLPPAEAAAAFASGLTILSGKNHGFLDVLGNKNHPKPLFWEHFPFSQIGVF